VPSNVVLMSSNVAPIDALKSYYTSGATIPAAVHEKYESLFREFIVVGGMPEVVNDNVQYHDFNRVDRLLDNRKRKTLKSGLKQALLSVSF